MSRKTIRVIIFILIVATYLLRHVDNQLQDAIVARCNNAAPNDATIQSCTDLIKMRPAQPVVFMKRAIAYTKMGKTDEAINDLNHSLEINPHYFSSLATRGSLYLSKGQYNDALHDLDLAMAPGTMKSNFPLIADLYWERGMAKFYAVSPVQAMEDLIKAIKIDPTNGLRVMWLHIARTRAGQDDLEEFQHNSNALPQEKWPAPLLAFYQDKMPFDELLSKAKTGNASEQADHMCDMNFYTAELYLMRDRKAEARNLFQATRTTCSKEDLEITFAQSELAALDATP